MGWPVVPPVKKMAAVESGSISATGASASAMEAAGSTFTPWSLPVRGMNSSRTKMAAMSNFMQEPMTAISGSMDGNIMTT